MALNEIGIEFNDNGFFDKLDALKSKPININVNFVGSDKSIKDLKKQITTVINADGGIKINKVSFTEASIKDLKKQVADSINADGLKINNISVSNVSAIKKQITTGINLDKGIEIRNVTVTDSAINSARNQINNGLSTKPVIISNVEFSIAALNSLQNQLSNLQVHLNANNLQAVQINALLGTTAIQTIQNQLNNLTLGFSQASIDAVANNIAQSIQSALNNYNPPPNHPNNGGGAPPSGGNVPPTGGGNPPTNPPNPPTQPPALPPSGNPPAPPGGGPPPRRPNRRILRGLIREEIINRNKLRPSAAGTFYNPAHLQREIVANFHNIYGAGLDNIQSRLLLQDLHDAYQVENDLLRRQALDELGRDIENENFNLTGNAAYQESLNVQARGGGKRGLNASKDNLKINRGLDRFNRRLRNSLAKETRDEENYRNDEFYQNIRDLDTVVARGSFDPVNDPYHEQLLNDLLFRASDRNPDLKDRTRARKEKNTLKKRVNRSEQRIKAAQREVDDSYFSHPEDVAEKRNVDPSRLIRGKFFDPKRLSENRLTGYLIARNSAEALLSKGPIEALASIAGGALGGSIGSTAGAAFGGYAGVTVASAGVEAFHKLAEALMEATRAGLTYQRSVIAISGVLLQNTRLFNRASGAPLSDIDQLNYQRKKADEIQRSSRAAAASIGIGGEAESNLVQAIQTGAGSRGIDLSADQTATLVKRFGSAINLFAPDLASNPNYIRRDLADILTGSGAASRTTLGSRLGPILNQISQATSGEDYIKATKALDKLVFAFQNSGDAVAKMQLFSAQIEKIKQDFGKSFVDEISPVLTKINEAVSSPQLSDGLSAFAVNLGKFINVLGEVTAYVARYINILLKTPLAREIGDLSNLVGAGYAEIAEAFTGKETIRAVEYSEEVENYIKNKKLLEPKSQVATVNEVRAVLEKITGNPEFRSIDESARGGAAVNIEGSKQLRGFAARKGANALDTYTQMALEIQSSDLYSEGLKRQQQDRSISFGGGLIGTTQSILDKYGGPVSNDLIDESDRVAISKAQAYKNYLNKFKESRTLSDTGARANALKIAEQESIIQNKQNAINERKNDAIKDAQTLGANAEALGKLKAEGFSKLSLSGQAGAEQAEIDAIKDTIASRDLLKSRIPAADKDQFDLIQNASKVQLADRKAQQPMNSVQRLGSTLSIFENLNNLNATFAKLANTSEELAIQFDLAETALKDFGKRAEIESLQGEDKIVASIKNLIEKGGTLTAEQSSRIEDILGGPEAAEVIAEATFGSGISKFVRDRKIATNELDLTLSEQANLKSKQRGEELGLENQKTDIQTRQAGLPLEQAGAKIQQVLAYAQLEQLLGDSDPRFKGIFKQSLSQLDGFFGKDKEGNIDLANIQLPGSALNSAATSLDETADYFKGGGLAKDIADAIKGIVPSGSSGGSSGSGYSGSSSGRGTGYGASGKREFDPLNPPEGTDPNTGYYKTPLGDEIKKKMWEGSGKTWNDISMVGIRNELPYTYGVATAGSGTTFSKPQRKIWDKFNKTPLFEEWTPTTTVSTSDSEEYIPIDGDSAGPVGGGGLVSKGYSKKYGGGKDPNWIMRMLRKVDTDVVYPLQRKIQAPFKNSSDVDSTPNNINTPTIPTQLPSVPNTQAPTPTNINSSLLQVTNSLNQVTEYFKGGKFADDVGKSIQKNAPGIGP